MSRERPRVAAPVLVGATAMEMVAAVRGGEVSPEELVRAHLDHIAEIDRRIGAFEHVCGERALAQAAEVARRDDLASLPLPGVPIAIKDNTPVGGETSRTGCRATPDAPSAQDHEVVRRLRAAGAVVVAIARMPEFGLWATSENAFGVARNPWRLDRSPGGSSGGSGAAVAAAMVPAAHSNDGLGSIRIPAAACGVFGIKPGPGLIPRDIGRTDGSWMSDHGALATTIDDAALALSAMAERPDLAQVSPPSGPLRFAVSWVSPAVGVGVDREWIAATRETGDLLHGAGHRVRWADPPYGRFLAIPGISRWVSGTAIETEGLDPALLTRATRRHAALGRMARRLGAPRDGGIERWRNRLTGFFREHDLLITPTLAAPPIAAAGWIDRSWLANVIGNIRFAPFAAAWNLAGYPAAAVPAGRHSDGTPLSVQLIAPQGGEALILSVAKLLEELRPWPRHAPGYGPAGGRQDPSGSSR